jgi:hypothetical protein
MVGRLEEEEVEEWDADDFLAQDTTAKIREPTVMEKAALEHSTTTTVEARSR